MSLFADVVKEARISVDGCYRYNLVRTWDADLPRVLWVMLNPSTADAATDDPTLRRCIGFSKAWGFGSLEVVNLFAWRASDPKELKVAPDPVGFENPAWWRCARDRCSLIVAAWGSHSIIKSRYLDAIDEFRNMDCLGMPKSYPCPPHPLYLPGDVERVPYVRDGYFAVPRQGANS